MEHLALVVVGMAYGDEGKGSVVDYLVREFDAHTVIRYNGGAQAAHNVVTPDGRHHTFAQFGSGTFVAGVRTHLSRFMLVNPMQAFFENEHLVRVGVTDALNRLSVDPAAIITTPFHVALNREVESQRGEQRHGSCGLGIGATVEDSLAHEPLRMRDLTAPLLEAKLRAIRARVAPHALLGEHECWEPEYVEEVADIYREFAGLVSTQSPTYKGALVFEGAQGVLLDEIHGFAPYTTWSNCTTANAENLLSEARFAGRTVRVGVTRAYATRHGPGPFPTEAPLDIPEPHNGFNNWQREWRVGHLDLPAFAYATARCPVDCLAVTHMDTAPDPSQVALTYDWPPAPFDSERMAERLATVEPEYMTIAAEEIPGLLAEKAGVPVALLSYGPTADEKVAMERNSPHKLTSSA